MWKFSAIILLLIALLSTSTNAQERAFSSAPIYQLSFDDVSTAPVGIEWQAGRDDHQGLAYFNGINQKVNLSSTNDDNGNAFPIFSSSFTLEAWVSYETFMGYSHWFSIGNGPSIDNIYCGNTGTGNTVRFGTVDTPFSNDTDRREVVLERAGGYSVGVFSHIVATANLISLSDTTSDNAAVLTIYVNGAFARNATQRNPREVIRTQQYLGRSLWLSDGYFNGWLDTFNIYNYALSTQAVFAHSYLRRVPVFELAFSEDPTQIAGSRATYSYVLADPTDVTNNVSQWHQGVVILSSLSSQYMDLTTNSGSSTSGTTLPSIGGDGYGSGSNQYLQGWSFEFTFRTPGSSNGSKIFDTAASTGSDRIYLGFDDNSINFYVQAGTTVATATPVLSTFSLNTWYHVVIVILPGSSATNAEHHVFINGANQNNYTARAYPAAVTRSAAYIGRSTQSTDPYADLVFDLVRIYDYRLNADLVLNLYYSVSQAAPSNPVPPPAIYSTSPKNVFGFDSLNSETGYASYTYINETDDGHFGVAAFNGVNSSINLLYYPDTNGRYISPYIGGGPMTFCIWAKFSAVPNWSRLFDFGGILGTGNNNIVFANIQSSTTLTFQVYSGSSVTSVNVDQAIQPGKWTHFCAVVDVITLDYTSPLAANLSIYIDGVKRGTSPGYIPPNVIRSVLFVGRSEWNDARFVGYMDSISYYDYALDNQQIAAHACTSRPPVFEFAFVSDPRLINPNITYQFGWTQTEEEVIPANTPYLNPANHPITFTHEGLLTFNGNNQYVNLTATVGPTSLGTQLPPIGGPGSGIGVYQGWSFEILFKCNSNATWSKIFDFGVNTGGDDDIILGFVDNTGNLAFEIWNSAVQIDNHPKNYRYNFINDVQIGQWYHVVIVVAPLSIETASAVWTIYVNGNSNDGFFGGVYPQEILRKNANVAKSNWQDNYFNGTIDSLRIYDYALNQNDVLALYRTTRSVAAPVLDTPVYHPGARNAYSFANGYDAGQTAVANYNWLAALDGHYGIASFDGSSKYVNLMGYTDSRGGYFPVNVGGTDLSFTAWVRYSAFASNSRIFDLNNGNNVQTLALMNIGTTSQLRVLIYSDYGNTAYDTNYNAPLNQWFHVAVTINRNLRNAINANNAAFYTVYINGTVVASGSGVYTSAAARMNNYLARSGGSDAYFNGTMDMFAWFDYALPADSVQAQAGLINPPFFELTFTTDPRITNVSSTFGYNWVDRDPSDPALSKHQGMIDLSPSQGQYVDLMQTRGNYSLGVFMPQVGGNTIGVDETAGWSFEIVFKLRNTSESFNYCKVLDLGNGPNGATGDDNIVFGLRPTGIFAFEVTNTRWDAHDIAEILPSTQPNVWYSIVVTVARQHPITFSAQYITYVNGAYNNSMGGESDIQGIYRQNAKLGKSEWNDPLCDIQIDVVRIYDYVLNTQEIAWLASVTVDDVVPPPLSSTGAAASGSSSSSSSASTPVLSSSSSATTPVASSSSSSASSPISSSSSVSSPISSSSSASSPISSSSSASSPSESSSSSVSAPVIGCHYSATYPDGSMIGSIIVQRPISSLPTNFGTALIDSVGALAGLSTDADSQNRIACTRAYNGNNVIAQVEPTADNTKVEFAFLNNGQPPAANLSSNFMLASSQLGSALSNRLGGTYIVTDPEVNPAPKPQGDDSSGGGLSDGAIAGIVIGCVVGGLLLIALAYFLLYGRKSQSGKTFNSNSTYQYKTHTPETHEDHIESHEIGTDEIEMEHV